MAVSSQQTVEEIDREEDKQSVSLSDIGVNLEDSKLTEQQKDKQLIFLENDKIPFQEALQTSDIQLL